MDTVAQLLAEALPVLDAKFGKESPKLLFTEEDGEEWGFYWCVVQTPLRGEEARRLLAEFDQEWWLKNVHRAKGRLNFDYELV